MKNIIKKVFSIAKAGVKKCCEHAKAFIATLMGIFLGTGHALAQSLAGTGYDAGTNALEEVATELVKYVPYVVNLCYALAGVVAIVGAISVYIAMNNEEQDVKNILVLKNWLKTIRKEMKQKFLCISHLQGYFAFPIFENMTLKKI